MLLNWASTAWPPLILHPWKKVLQTALTVWCETALQSWLLPLANGKVYGRLKSPTRSGSWHDLWTALMIVASVSECDLCSLTFSAFSFLCKQTYNTNVNLPDGNFNSGDDGKINRSVPARKRHAFPPLQSWAGQVDVSGRIRPLERRLQTGGVDQLWSARRLEDSAKHRFPHLLFFLSNQMKRYTNDVSFKTEVREKMFTFSGTSASVFMERHLRLEDFLAPSFRHRSTPGGEFDVSFLLFGDTSLLHCMVSGSDNNDDMELIFDFEEDEIISSKWNMFENPSSSPRLFLNVRLGLSLLNTDDIEHKEDRTLVAYQNYKGYSEWLEHNRDTCVMWQVAPSTFVPLSTVVLCSTFLRF